MSKSMLAYTKKVLKGVSFEACETTLCSSIAFNKTPSSANATEVELLEVSMFNINAIILECNIKTYNLIIS